MKIQIPRKTGSFAFEAKGRDISQHLAKILELTKEASLSGSIVQHFIGVYQGRVFVLGYSSEVLGLELIATVGTGEGIASIDADAIRSVLKSKEQTSVTFEGSEVSWKSGRAKGTFPTKTLLPDTAIYVNNRLSQVSDAPPLPKKLLQNLTEGTKITELRDIYKIEATLVTHLVCRKGDYLQIVSYDRYHAAMFQSDVKSDRDFQVSMPTKLFQIVSKFTSAQDTEAKFYVDATGLRVVSDTYVLDLPPVQVNQSELNMALSMVNNMRLWSRFKLSGDSMTNIKDALSLADPKGGSSFGITVDADKKRLKLDMVSTRGNTTETLKLKDSKSSMGSFSSKVDPRLLIDVVKRISGDSMVSVYGRGEMPEPALIQIATDLDGKKFECWSALL